MALSFLFFIFFRIILVRSLPAVDASDDNPPDIDAPTSSRFGPYRDTMRRIERILAPGLAAALFTVVLTVIVGVNAVSGISGVFGAALPAVLIYAVILAEESRGSANT